MKRLFVRILLLSLLQYASMADEANPDKIEDCPANKVCAIFVSDTCKVNGVRPDAIALAGYIWENETSCDTKIYKDHYARLDIQPSSLHNWSFVLTHWDDGHKPAKWKPDGSYDEQHIWNIGFDFGNAKITFIAATMVQCAWKKTGESEWHNSLHELTFIRKFQVVDGKFKFMQYSFNIESKEKLSMFFGKKQFSLMRMEANETVTLKDPRFLELLEQRASCDPLNSVCHGGCDEMEIRADSSAASCASNSPFWIHNNNEAMLTRHWKAASELKCKMNSWEAAWNGAEMTLLLKIVKGFAICAAILILVLNCDTSLYKLVRLFTFFFLLCSINAYDVRALPACTTDMVCTFFAYDSCKIDSHKAETGLHGFIWNENSGCDRGDYGSYYAGMNFQPLTLQKWKFEVTSWISDDAHLQNVECIGFNFRTANLTFPSKESVRFDWSDGVKNHSSLHKMDSLERFNTNGLNFEKYSFSISNEKKNLVEFFAEETFSFVRFGKTHIILRDARLKKMLENLSPCIFSDINEEKGDLFASRITYDSEVKSTLQCGSQLWLLGGIMGTWTQIASVRCTRGKWIAHWKEGSLYVTSKMKLVCSAMTPDDFPITSITRDAYDAFALFSVFFVIAMFSTWIVMFFGKSQAHVVMIWLMVTFIAAHQIALVVSILSFWRIHTIVGDLASFLSYTIPYSTWIHSIIRFRQADENKPYGPLILNSSIFVPSIIYSVIQVGFMSLTDIYNMGAVFMTATGSYYALWTLKKS